MAGDSSTSRDQPFRDLLLSVSKQLSESDVEELRYLGDHQYSCKALELLKALRNKGMFSPNRCSRLAELLRKIERHDLADEVMSKYVTVFPDQQTSPPSGGNGRRRRSATDPVPLTKSTSIDTASLSSQGPSSLPQSFSGEQITGGQCSGSLDNVFPTTPTSGWSLDGHSLHQQSLVPSRTSSSSLKSISQSSQDHAYSSYASSNSSSHSSLNSAATEAVLDRASTMLFNHVTASLNRNLPQPHDFGNPSVMQIQHKTQTLPSRMGSQSLVYHRNLEAIRGPTISEIYSDHEDGGLEDRRDTLECPAAIASRHRKEMEPHSLSESGTSSFQKDVEASRTPRASLLLQEDQGAGEKNTTQGTGNDADLTTLSPGSSGSAQTLPQQANKPLPSKEKNWKKRLIFFGKHKMKQSSGNFITWRLPREDLGRPIWNHDEKCCISRSHKFELDTNLGRHNPKLLFQLYPYGESSDCGEYMTMIVRVNTSDKCPPLPPSATVQISLTVRDDGSEGEGSVLNQTSVEKHLNLGYFPIRQVVQHCQLKKSRSKFIYFDLEMTCNGLDVEPHPLTRLPTS